MNELALWLDALSIVGVVVFILGMLVLFLLGCNLAHKSRVFHVFSIMSAFGGYLIIQNQVLHADLMYEYAIQVASIVPVLTFAVLMIGAIVFGENDIKRHRKNERQKS